MYLDDFAEDSTIYFQFTTNTGTGGAVAPSSAFEAADLKIYKDGAAFAPNGVSMTSPFDTITGLHAVTIDTSNDGGDNWVTGADYSVVLSPDETVDGETVVRVVASFSIQNRYMRGTDSAALAVVVGALADIAAADEVDEAKSLMQYIKQLVNILVGAPGVATLKAAAAPASGVSLSEMIRGIYDDRTLAAADYVVVGDTIARVTLTDTVTDNSDLVTAAAIKTALEADDGYLSILMEALVNKLLIDETNGDTIIHNTAGASQGTVLAAFTSVANTTKRERIYIAP